MVYTVDVPKVRGKMSEKGYNITSLSGKMGVNRNTLSNYLENPAIIPYGKLTLMAALLCDSREECADLFFTQKLTQTQE